MDTLARLTQDLTASMKARDTARTTTLRQLIAAVRTEEKAGTSARELTEEQVQAVLVREQKTRRESAQIYAEAGADDRAAAETAEADLIEEYLPRALGEAELDALVGRAVAETGATGMKDMGAVMRAANAAAAGGRVDGKALSQKVRSALGG